MGLLFTILKNTIKFKKLNEREVSKKYKTTNFQLIDTKYEKQLSVTLDNDFKILLPDT